MTWTSPDDADWNALTALKATYDAFRDNYVPLIATSMIWLMPTFILDALGFGPRALVAYEMIVGGLLLMGLAPSVAESLLGHPVPVRDCLVMSVKRLRPGSLPLVLIMMFAIGGALVLLVLPGILLAAAWCVAAPVKAAEKAGVTAALRRSMVLTRGRMFRIASVVVLYATVVFFLVMGGKVLAGTVSSPDDQTFARLIGFVVDATLLALTPCLTTVLYALLRFEKEGITLELVTDTLH